MNVTVEGGELLAFGSANPRTEERYDEGSFSTHYGRAMAVVSAKVTGCMVIHVSGNALIPAKTVINITEHL
ncbi:hypothetical protein AGMMS49991_12160 [Spirochaetia bacterium]|nr:hypothetical protein AGMMS49991_12160 [Spirochaetia bacterium]